MHEKNKYSIIKPEKSPIFYGYIVLLFGSIGILASIPGQTVGVSVFTDPVKEALGLSRTNFSNAYMIGTLLSALIVAKAGVWFDRFGARYVAFFAVIFLAFGLFLFSFSQTLSRNISELLQVESWIIPFTIITILFFIIRFCGQGVLTMASRNMIMLWFDKNRGKVNSISSIAVSLGFSASPILINKLIDDYGWQMSWQIIAICLVVFSVFILQFYRNKPEDFGMKPDGVVIHKEQKARKNVRDFTLIEAKKTRAFWIISLILAFNSFFFTGFTFHVVSIFESAGFSKTQAISIFLPISIIAISTSTCGNIFSDYIKHKIYIFIMILAGFMASLGLIFLKESLGLYLLIIGLGVLGGLFTVINAVTWPRYYGRLYLGAITGKVMSVLVIASAVAPTLFSYCFTVFGSYSYVSYITVVILLFVTIASLKVKNPQK